MKMVGQFYLPTPDLFHKIILSILGLGFLFGLVFGRDWSNLISLAPSLSLNSFWQIGTYWAYQSSFMALLFNALLLFSLGQMLQSHWGKFKYRLFLSLVTLGGGVFFLFLSFFNLKGGAHPYQGIHGVINALLIAYALYFPNQLFSFLFIFPVKAKYFVWGLIVLELYWGAMSGSFTVAITSFFQLFLGGAIAFFWMSRKIGPSRGSILTEFSGGRPKSKANLRLISSKENQETQGQQGPKYWQ